MDLGLQRWAEVRCLLLRRVGGLRPSQYDMYGREAKGEQGAGKVDCDVSFMAQEEACSSSCWRGFLTRDCAQRHGLPGDGVGTGPQ